MVDTDKNVSESFWEQAYFEGLLLSFFESKFEFGEKTGTSRKREFLDKNGRVSFSEFFMKLGDSGALKLNFACG